LNKSYKMKSLPIILLSFLFVISNSCHHSKLTFGDKYKKKNIQTEQEFKINSDSEYELSVENDHEKSHDIKEKKTIEERSINVLVSYLDQEESEKFHEFINKKNIKEDVLDKSENLNLTKENSTGKPEILIIVGIILLVIGISFVFVAINKLEKSDGSPEGCITAIASGFLLVVLASIIGVLGMIMLIIGIVLFTDKS
jgi:hypothetical protein